MTTHRVVITGIGALTPAGLNINDTFDNVLAGRKNIREIDRFDASKYPSRHAGLIDGFTPDMKFNKRLLKKLDRFSHLSLQAADDAMADAGIDMAAEDAARVGIILGNALGGWEFAEAELRDLWQGGLREVSPYQATAWFPAAPQGQISIYYGIKGFAKTIISDIASSHIAIGYAMRAIRTGKADVILAGGAEAPISPYALLCCNTSGELSTTGTYMPFDKSRDGYVIGEGAGILVIEERERAIRRGARIYAELTGFGHTSDGVDAARPGTSGDALAHAMKLAMGRAGVDGVDYIMPGAMAGVEYDVSESRAINSVFGENVPTLGIPKSLFGNTLGASGTIDVALACIAMQRGISPAHTGCTEPDEGCGWAATNELGVNGNLDNVMVNSIGRGGVNASLILSKPKE
jgi:3-oxoacyl-(acyl-carrier-protein) synthase